MSAINTEVAELNFHQLIDMVAKTSKEVNNLPGVSEKIIFFKDGNITKKLQAIRREKIGGPCVRAVDDDELAPKIKELLESGQSFCLKVVGAKPVEWRLVN